MLNNHTRDKIITKFGKKLARNNTNVVVDIDELELENAGNDKTYITDNNDLEIIFRAEEYFQKVPPKTEITNQEICIYSIKNFEGKPFIVYTLYNNNNNILDWLSVKNYNDKTVESLCRSLKKDFNMSITLKGMLANKIQDQLWFELIDNDMQTKHATLSQKHIPCLISEIVNTKKHLNINISNTITEFLLDNPEFIFLYNKQNKKYEIPEVGYYGNYFKKIAITAAIGLRRESPFASVGSYYYFAGYGRAMRYAVKTSFKKPMRVNGELITIDDIGTYTRGGIVRFALFLGKSTCLLGRENDKSDTSVISLELSKKKRLESSKTNKFCKKMIKYRDSDGTWTQNYDSIIIGKNTVDCEGKSVMMEPQTTVKLFTQQLSLSYYYINTSQHIIDNELESVMVE